MFGAVAEAAHDDARQAVFALEARQVRLKATVSRMSRPGLWAMISRQFAGSGADSGASQMRKSSAPPELVVMIRRSPWCSMLYSWPCWRGAINRAGAFRLLSVDQIGFIGLVVMGVDDDELA